MTHLLFCDETTVERSTGGKFFLYCGLVVAPEAFGAVCDVVTSARAGIGLQANEPLKFSPRACPQRVGRDDWTAAKLAVLLGLSKLHLPFIGVYVHESIARAADKTHWAIDALCVTFNEMIVTANTRGFVVVDHTKDIERGDLADIASGAVAVSIFRSDLSSIGGIASGHVEAALPLQAVDVVLGSFRYCMEHPDYNVSVEMYRALDGLSGSLEQRPWNVKIPTYQTDYRSLRDDWTALGQRAAT